MALREPFGFAAVALRARSGGSTGVRDKRRIPLRMPLGFVEDVGMAQHGPPAVVVVANSKWKMFPIAGAHCRSQEEQFDTFRHIPLDCTLKLFNLQGIFRIYFHNDHDDHRMSSHRRLVPFRHSSPCTSTFCPCWVVLSRRLPSSSCPPRNKTSYGSSRSTIISSI
jgi:hypothetical protein